MRLANILISALLYCSLFVSSSSYGSDSYEYLEEVVEIYVSGGDFSYPHYTFSDSGNNKIDLETYEFQPDKTYQFTAANLNKNHPFTLGVRIGESAVTKFSWVDQVSLSDDFIFNGNLDQVDNLGAYLLTPPIDDPEHATDYILTKDGDYFEFSYSEDHLWAFFDLDVKFYYICNNHSSMNGRFYLSIEEDAEEAHPVYELDSNQIWHLSDAETHHMQYFTGYFALVESNESMPTESVDGDHVPAARSYFLVEVELENGPTSPHPDFPHTDPYWILKNSYHLYDSIYDRTYIEDEMNLHPVGYFDGNIVPPIEDPLEISYEFLENLRAEISIDGNEFLLENLNAVPVWADILTDVLDESRFVYEVGLNNMINLYFDKNGVYLHASDEYTDNKQYIPNSEIAREVLELIATELPESRIIDFNSENSVLEVPNYGESVYFAIVENNQSEMFEVVINGDQNGIILAMPFKDYTHLHPVEFPENAVAYMEQNYLYEDGYPITFWVDERPTPDGSAMELVAYLEDDREAIFNRDGTFNREFNPWNREEDPKLAFNSNRSAWGDDLSVSNFSDGATMGNNPAHVHVEKLDVSTAAESHQEDEYFGGGNWDDMVYRVSLVNSDLSEDGNLSISDLELSNTELSAGTPLKLTFTYEMGEPRYILVSGANILGFKRTWPEWDVPGSFTILAETVDAVSTSDGDLVSTFGMVVVMGGERYYNGAIFQANIPVLDLSPSELIAPYEQAAAFSLGAELSGDINASISAFLPRDLLEWKFGISEPHRVKAGLMDENGSLLFINGCGADEDGAQFTGGGFTRIIHNGYEPDYHTYPHEGGDEDYKLGDHNTDEGFIDSDEDAQEGEIKSRFDFNADGFGDSLLEVRFFANAFPAEVGFGDPYEDPYKDFNKENMGSIVGSVLDESGQVIPDFGLWFFQAPDGIDGPWEPEFFILESNFSTGAYQAYLPEGDYYVEAWGFDPNTGTPYKPQVSESSFTIVDASSSYTLDFELVQDYVVSHEYGEITSNLSVSGLGANDRLDISLELYPVEQDNSRITDYPTGWLWVEPNGEISGESPSGRYEVVLFSYDNSVRLREGPIFWDILPNQLNEFSTLQASKAQPLQVSGVVYDADKSVGIWADIVFVDPADEYREFWPQWEPVEFEDSDSYVEGSYSVKIPAGTYKIKAMRWDGLYQSEYYTSDGEGTTDFSSADSVVIKSDLPNIDFNLNGVPAAQVQVRIVDANSSNAVEFAWFAFFDAEDEYGPVVYPYVLEDEGNYSLKLPGGNYKVMVEAGGYEPKFLSSDADGNYSWDSADWSSAASLGLADGNLTSLPLAELYAFGQEDHVIYDFEWFDEDAGITFGTISGKVVTTKGNAVPKARIVAHTDDYLFWFDHFEAKVDGTYELGNLPAGNWIVFAEPPFESEEYLGYQSSIPNWDSPIIVDANSTTDIKLTLQGSNVSGRIMYPKKNEDTGQVRLVGLQHAFLWVFQDENDTGEPNYNHVEGEEFIFNEAYGETNEDGFFAFSLPEAGKYSMRIELPGNLANLALTPVHFELKNPAKEMRLGNALRIDWSKAETRATTFKLERKLNLASVYTTLDDNISGSEKSYVDYTIVPGSSYDYKLTAVNSNGSKAIGDSSYKVSKPFIYLAPPSKTISGKVQDDFNASISGAEVVAWRMDGEGSANTFTDTSGSYELSVGAGKWEVTVYRPWNQNVNWSYEKAPKPVTFANTTSKTKKTINFSVNRMGDGKVVGTIDIPTGITDAASSIYIDVFSPDGIGNWANPESNGSFTIPLKPGQYELSVWLDPDKFKGYGSPEPQFIRITETEFNVGTISLREYNSIISGVIATSSGSPLGNAEVWAWSETGGWTSDVTDTTGAFELRVAPGRWEVGFNPPIPADGSESPYLLEPPQRIKVGEGFKTLNFTVRKATSKVEGVVYGPSGAPVADLNAWAYAREVDKGNDSEEIFNVLAEVPLSPRGTFSFPGLPGTYSVGLWLPPASAFSPPDEQILTLSEEGQLSDQDGSSLTKIEFYLEEIDSYLLGSLNDNETNDSISGLVGEVYAVRVDGDGWQSAVIESNGSYSMALPAGEWMLDFNLEYDDLDRNYPNHATVPVDVMIQQGEIVTQNFTLSSATASISGKVVYDATDENVTDSTLYVWAYREPTGSLPEYWNEVETDENGVFSLSVLQGGYYEVGVILSKDLREIGYLEPVTQNIKMTNPTKSGVEFRLSQPPPENFLSGKVLDDLSNPLPGAFVYAWTFDGRESSTYANSNGEFNMTVPRGVLWQIGAEFSEFDSSDHEVVYLTESEEQGDLRSNDFKSDIFIVLKRPEFVVPDGVSITFDPSKDFTTTLPDGTELTIPGGASNVPTTVDEVHIVITPTAMGLVRSGSEKPANYGYSLELFDEKGKKVEGNFKKDVILQIPIDTNSARASGLDVDNFEGMYFSSTKNAWDKVKTSTWNKESEKLVLTTDHFSLYAGVTTPELSDLTKHLGTSVTETFQGDWYESSWLGFYFDANDGWIFHHELGWLYIKEDNSLSEVTNFWLYHPSLKWLWTGEDFYHVDKSSQWFLYSEEFGSWVYKFNKNMFYNYNSSEWIQLD